ncbi:MAG: PSD1 and planctomycete cytochrome C domain-containing protein [Akkermansiaceae bacterium]|nr:PSD1 and planctomycete cytochrome C domain-containing protein [Akkermansiaceae bacterium]
MARLSLFLTFALISVTFSQEVVFNRDIRPILSNKCFFCHGPDEKTREGDLRLDTREGALEDHDGFSAVVPGKPDDSEIIYRVAEATGDEAMPPQHAKKESLTKSEVALFRRWIEQGAPYQGHWSFEPLAKTTPPASWHGNPIDYYVNTSLTKLDVSPSPAADRATLIRRLSLDLTGLLPTPEETKAFLNDKSPDAWTKLVDRLLTSPHYGERWGRHWLDQARYADSHGYSVDGGRDMWPYRDWVIKAINDDLPFNQFTIEQLAGDLLPNRTKSQHIASAFHRNTLINQEGGSDREQFRVESVIDRVNTTGAVWLGLTVGCAQCHTHKFDPITHREYYELFAFFNNTEDANGTGPTVEVKQFEILGNAPKPPAPPKTGSSQPFKWLPVSYDQHRTSSGAPLKLLKNNSLLVGKSAKPKEAYDLKISSKLKTVAALRLRVLPDKSLPKNGPGTASNGNFVLTNLSVKVDGKPIRLTAAFADHEQPGFPASAIINRDKGSGWAINVVRGQKAKMNSEHEVTFLFDKPIATKGKPLLVRMEHNLNDNYLVGRFAIDLSATAPPIPKGKSPGEVKPRTGKLMVMKELAKPRTTYLLTRGDFTRPNKDLGELTPGILSKVKPALPDPTSRRNRLDLAKWLVDPANPLTPRVTVNRTWMRYFGRGLVETEEDFGTQGSPPTHPDLLDNLASRFIEDGWSMKKLHRLIVTSETYRRSSKARPDLADLDPRNLLLARQSRLRLDAEIIRDAALSASGLFTPTIGGPGVYPPQPDGIYAFTQNRKSWRTSTGPDRYRRAMYTFFYRSAPYPLLSTFDAPDFQTVCTHRVRSNTPLQALTIANDPAFLEISQGLAARLLRDSPGALEPKIRHAFQLALCREPSVEELSILSSYLRQQVSDFSKDEDAARALLSDDLLSSQVPPAEAAALVGLTRAILNTDNFITRE